MFAWRQSTRKQSGILTSAAEMKPLPSLSNTLKASRSSSSESESCTHVQLWLHENFAQARCLNNICFSAQDRCDKPLHLHLPGHQIQKLWEVDGAIPISIYFVDHVLQLWFSWVLTQRPHHCPQLFRCDGAYTSAYTSLNWTWASCTRTATLWWGSSPRAGQHNSCLCVFSPSPSLSNKAKASLNSATCSSVNCAASVMVPIGRGQCFSTLESGHFLRLQWEVQLWRLLTPRSVFCEAMWGRF